MILGSMLISLHYMVREKYTYNLKNLNFYKAITPQTTKAICSTESFCGFFSWICQHFVNLNTSPWTHTALSYKYFFVNSAFYFWTPRN